MKMLREKEEDGYGEMIDDESEMIESNIPDEIGENEFEGFDIKRPNAPKALSERDLCRRTASIFESTKECKIKIEYDKTPNCIYTVKNKGNTSKDYTIVLTSPEIKSIKKYTALNHELGHVAFDSLIGELSNEYFVNQAPDKLKGKYLNFTKEFCRMAANILEDERIESLIGDMYLGTAKRFEVMKKGLGKGCIKSFHPCGDLLNTRFGRSDLIKDKKTRKLCEQYIEDVRLTGKDGLLVIGNKFLKELLIPWMIENAVVLPDPPIVSRKGKGNGIGEANNEARDFNQNCDHKGLYNDGKMEDKGLEKAKERGEKDVKDLKDKIDENNRKQGEQNHMPEDCGRINMLDRYDSSISLSPNNNIAVGLNRIFRELQSKKKYKLYDEGEMLDMPALIRRKARGFGQVFMAQRKKESLTMVVSVDVSGSMNGLPVEVARDMCATIFKAIQGIKGLKFHTFAWNGGSGRLDISEINRYQECKSINTKGEGSTPTPQAMAYSVARLNQMGGKKKVLIFITDGSPDNGAIGAGMVRKWVKIAREAGIMVIGMYPAGHGYNVEEAMKSMFGTGNFMIFNDMKTASSTILAKFKHIAISQVRR